MTWLHDKTVEMRKRVADAKEKRAFPFFKPFENVGSRVKVGSGSYINFTSNDYLGLSQTRPLINAAIAGTEAYGTGMASARLQAHSVRHQELERRLAQWMRFEACCNTTTGYQSLVGFLSAYLDDDVTVCVDRLNHASIMDGVLLAKGQHPDLEIRLFRHNSMKHLDKCLKTAEHQKKMVVVEGLYSVDGDFSKLADIVEVCKKHDAVLVVDDAHGLGTMGPTGRGVGEIFGVLGEIDVLIGTFSKSFGTIGGFVLADQAVIDYMKLTARAFMFSAALPIPLVEAAISALDIIENDRSHQRRLEDNARFFRDGLLELGFDLGESCTHITPIFVNDEEKTMAFGAYLYHGAGVIMMPFIAPGVPKNTERLRCNVTSAHSRAEMGYTLEALAEIGGMLDIIPKGKKTSFSTAQKALWLAENKLAGVRNGGLGFVAAELRDGIKKLDDWRNGRSSEPAAAE